MKKLYLILLSSILLSFAIKSNLKTDYNTNTWIQYVGKDSTMHIYKFRDVNGAKLLQSITVKEKNPKKEIKEIFTNDLIFDSLGKINKVFVTSSAEFVQEKGGSKIKYDIDKILIKENKFSSVSISNKYSRILNIYKVGNFIVNSEDDGIDYPIFNLQNIGQIQFKKIGKGVNPSSNSTDYQRKLEDGIYRRHK